MENLRTGDNLRILKQIHEQERVDLIYADPPFNSGRNFNVTVDKSLAQQEAYKDTWNWNPGVEANIAEALAYRPELEGLFTYLRAVASSMLPYIAMMAPRLILMHMCLRSSGSLYLHCDPTASHYLKVLLDAIFGKNHFRSEIVWERSSGHNNRKSLGAVHDTILYYTKSKKFTWNPIFEGLKKGSLQSYHLIEAETGRRYALKDLTVAKPGGDTFYEWEGHFPPKGRYWVHCREGMDQLKADGRVGYNENGYPGRIRYLEEVEGRPLQDLWLRSSVPGVKSEEKCPFNGGQKPLALIERIILQSSNPGDCVLDPFLGTGTTAIAAHRLGRRWIGIEWSEETARVAIERLDREIGEAAVFHGDPADINAAKALAAEHNYEFQCWAVRMLEGIPGPRGGDGGVDGTMLLKGFYHNKAERGIIQVKGRKVTRDDLRGLKHCRREKGAILAVMVAFESHVSKGILQAAKKEGYFVSGDPSDHRMFDCVQVVFVEDLFKNQRFGGLDIPGWLKKPDPSESPNAKRREATELYEFVMDLGDEED